MTSSETDFGALTSGTPAPCRAACPVGTDASAYIALMDEGRISDAYDVARQHNPFPSVCGRVCSAPCERSCRRGIVDESVSIRALKRVLCDVHGAEQGAASRWLRAVGAVPPPSRGSVGIIGAGPAGLAAAHDLRASGFAVTVYEALPAAGGMMRFGIPAFRLPRHVLDAEINAILGLGIELRVDCAIGRDISFATLLSQHAAVLVTVGCQRGRTMRVPGVDLPGVMRAVDFLRMRSALTGDSSRELHTGAMVVVGAGSVAFDAARSAWRDRAAEDYDEQTIVDVARSAIRGGKASVTMIAPQQRAQLSVPAEELREAVNEGVVLRDGFGLVRVLGETRVTGVEVAPVLAVLDGDGRFNPKLDLEHTVTIDAASVVLAIGQESDTDFLSDTPEIDRTPRGGIAVNDAMRSTHPKVWAAGDVATGPRDLIDAIAAGQRAAASIVRTLAAEISPLANYVPRTVASAPAMHNATRFWSGYEGIPRARAILVPDTKRDAVTEVEQSLAQAASRAEASRCLRCDEHMQFSPARCVVCALCVDVCPQASLALLPAGGESLALVFDDDTCIRCGLCVHRCPTDALHFENVRVLNAPMLRAPALGATATNAPGINALGGIAPVRSAPAQSVTEIQRGASHAPV